MASKNNIWHSTQAFPARLLQHTLQGSGWGWKWITNQGDGISGDCQCPWCGLWVTNTTPGCQDVSQQHQSRCCWTGSRHLKDMWADNNHRWLLIWSCKLIAPQSPARRKAACLPATVQDRLGGINHLYQALLKLPWECSNSAQAWQAANIKVNTQQQHTPEKESFLLPLGIYSITIDGISLTFLI